MKKIAVVHNLTSGGAVRVLDETNKLLSRKYIITIFSPPKNKFSEKNFLNKVGNYVQYVYKTLPDYYQKISKEINSGNYHAVIIHPDTFLKAPSLLSHLKINSIYILHEPPREFYEPIYLHAPFLRDKIFTLLRIPVAVLDKVATKKASHIVANSEFSRREIHKIYGVRSKVIYPGLTSKPVKMRKNLKRKYACLSVGSLLPYKGHELTIEALGMMSKKPVLIIVGNGREVEKNRLRDLAKRNGVRLRIVNNVSDEVLYSLYKSARVYVNSAYKEPFGLASLEALSSGENLVTVNECGTQELKKYFGDKIKVVNRTPKSISEGITKMINEKNSIPQQLAVFRWNYYVSELSKLIEND